MKLYLQRSLCALLFLAIGFGQVEFIPSNLDLGPVTVDSTLTYDIQIVSGVAQTVSLSGLDAPFSVSPETFVFEQEALSFDTLTATLTFNPTEVQTYNDTLSASGSIWGTVDLPIVGEGVLVGISLDEDELDFGEVSIGQSNVLSVNVTNNGVGTMAASISASNHQYTLNPDFIEIGTDSTTEILVTFSPDTAGVTDAILSFLSNDPINPEVTVDLIGVGKTDIEGEISGVWSPGNNPYHMIGHVNIPNDSTLTILPGVEVIFDSNYDFRVYGTLFANGTADDKIKFSGKGQFNYDNADDVQTSHCQYGDYSIDEWDENINEAAEEGTYEDFNSIDNINEWDENSDWDFNGSCLTRYTATGSDGTTAIRAYGDCGNWSTYDNWIYSPTVDFNEDMDSFSFDFRTDWYDSCNDYFRVYISIDDGGWQEVYYRNCEDTGWITVNIDISNYEGETIRVGFRNRWYRWGDLRIDNFNMSGYTLDNGYIYSNNMDINLDDSSLLGYYVYSDNDANVSLNNTDMSNTQSGYDCIRTTGADSYVTLQNSNLYNCSDDGIETGGTSAYVELSNSSVNGTGKYGIYTSNQYSYITLDNSSVENASSYGLLASNHYSPITISNSTVDNNGSYGIHADGDYSPVEIYSSSVSDNNSYGIHTNNGYSPITVHDSYINNNNGTGLYTSSNPSGIEIRRSEVIGNNGYGAYMSSSSNSDDHVMRVEHSRILDNNDSGLYVNGKTDVENSVIADNNSYGIRTNYPAEISYTTIFNNQNHGIYHSGGYYLDVTNSIIFDNDWDGPHHQIYNGGYLSIRYSIVEAYDAFGVTGNNNDNEFYQGPGILPYDPLIADEFGALNMNSPAVDGGEPWQHDAHMPPGLGTVVSDMGVYGGPNNAYWGGQSVPDGTPSIVDILDIPQDEGGWVGLQFNGSIFDYDHFGYDITHYSVWRAMDVDGQDSTAFSTAPNGDYFNIPSDTREEYFWEHLGDMGALNHDSYGYSAETIADSTSAGQFLTTYMVVAHTDTEDIYFMSDPASGYSVDNLAPESPMILSTSVTGTDVEIVWSGSPEPDFTHYRLFRNSEFLTELYDSSFVDTEMAYGSYVEYSVSSVDIHENESEESLIEGLYVNTPGDVNADFTLNVLDLITIINNILNAEDNPFDEVQQTIADYNGDGSIDIMDVVQLINLLVDARQEVPENLDKASLIIKDDALTHDGNESVSYQFTVSHGENAVIELTKNAFIAESYTQGERTEVIIMHPTGEQLLTCDGSFKIEDQIGVTLDGYIEVDVLSVPEDFTIDSAYPNPFNPSTQINFGLPLDSNIDINVYDINGRLVAELFSGNLEAGYHSQVWNAQNVSSGVYLILLKSEFGSSSQKVMLLK